MKISKKQVVGFLKNTLKKIDNTGNFWDYQEEYNNIQETIKILERN